MNGYDYYAHPSDSYAIPWYEDDDLLKLNISIANCSLELESFLESGETKITVPIIYSIICFIGLVGNALVMFVIFGSKEMTKTVANIYIWNLAVADTLLLLSLPFSSTQRVLISWPFGTGMCKIVESVKYLNFFASIFFLTAMSIDRYIAVVYTVASRRWRTSRNTYFVCAAIWLVAMVMVIPLFMTTGIYGGICTLFFNGDFEGDELLLLEDDFELTLCERMAADVYGDYSFPAFGRANNYVGEISGDYNLFGPDYTSMNVTAIEEAVTEKTCKHAKSKTFHAFLVFTSIVGFLIPFVIICVCYVMIVAKLLKSSEKRNRSKRAEKTRRKVTRMVIALAITFFVCWLPFHIWHLVRLEGIDSSLGVCHFITDFTCGLGYANSCFNPFLYTFLGHNFQKRLRKSIANSFRALSMATFTTNTISRAETAGQTVGRKKETSSTQTC